MSIEYDVKCLDCGSRAGFDFHNSVASAQICAEQGPVLARIAVALHSLDASVRGLARRKDITGYCTLHTMACYLEAGGHSPRQWLNVAWWREHGNHRLVACDGYGEEHPIKEP